MHLDICKTGRRSEEECPEEGLGTRQTRAKTNSEHLFVIFDIRIKDVVARLSETDGLLAFTPNFNKFQYIQSIKVFDYRGRRCCAEKAINEAAR